MPHAVWIVFFLALGACIGSFLNVVIYRLPRGESIVFPGSHCPSCGRALAWFDNIPIVSYLALRARCRYCHTHISAQYPLIESLTALLVGGLYVAYYVLDVREGLGTLEESWPIFTAHAVLLCSLLACTIVDIRQWQVPLEVCWFAAAVGVVLSAAFPKAMALPTAPPALGAAAIGACLGLAGSICMLRRGWILPSFLDAEELPSSDADTGTLTGVAMTSDCGVNPRIEVLREVLFLLPVLGGAALGAVLVTWVGPVQRGWVALHDLAGGVAGAHLAGFYSALLGYLVGGAWIWGMRIGGTLGFGKEAMGLGDVHILAAVGAVGGWVVPSVAFFLAPVFGLAWAVSLWLRKGQRELPYGPWLSLASVVVLVAYDPVLRLLERYNETFRTLFGA